jgi:hypothetical protein
MSDPEDLFFETLAEIDKEATAVPAPSRLKAKIYSALVRRQSQSGPLASLSATKASGRGLCIFEELVEVSPVPEQAKCVNYCSVCHARILAERIEHAPIYWSHCPYVRLQNR